jgi:hypothetical protein
MQELINQVIQWGEDRGIFEHSNPTKQLMKSASELGEIFDAFAKEDWDNAKLEIGDFMVTLILFGKMIGLTFSVKDLSKIGVVDKVLSIGDIHHDFSLLFRDFTSETIPFENAFKAVLVDISLVCQSAQLNPKECLQKAYTKISNRQTKMVNGVAVK